MKQDSRGVFCNRTLNLNAIRAIGYDMDYTLIHYRMEEWEQRAYTYIQERLKGEGWPVGELAFDPELVMRGLIVDVESGNMVKANRFGYIKRAFHGTRPLDFDEQRRFYQRTLVDLNAPRWFFINTLFSISEACMYLQLVDLLDQGALQGNMGYSDLFWRLRRSFDEAHMEGRLKAEIIAAPERFVDLDEAMPLALLDQKQAGKKLLLISNSEWSYVAPMMGFVFDPFLPAGMTWRELFDVAIVGARKPNFFSYQMPAFEVVSEEGLLREHRGPLRSGSVYLGGSAALVEQSLGFSGEEILYVGDHIFADVNISKSLSRWRTALVLRELEAEIAVLESFRPTQAKLSEMMARKETLEAELARLRLELQRAQKSYGPRGVRTVRELERALGRLFRKIEQFDDTITPLAQAAGKLLNPNWGLLMRAGVDKSHFARQVESHADIYMARVSDFLAVTPFAFLRSRRGSLPHDAAGTLF